MNPENFLLGYEVITMITVLVVTKEKSLGTDFNQENWMLVIWLVSVKYFFLEVCIILLVILLKGFKWVK